jgi:response regulator of citrate/malate metabolism
MNDLTAQFNLFKRRWESGDSSLNYIDKSVLTQEEKEYVNSVIDTTSVQFGITRLAKKLGVSEVTLRNYMRQKSI